LAAECILTRQLWVAFQPMPHVEMCVAIRGKFPHQRVCVRWISGNVLPSTDYGMITTGAD